MQISETKKLTIGELKQLFYVNKNFYQYYHRTLKPQYGFDIVDLSKYLNDLYERVIMYADNWEDDPYGLHDYVTDWVNSIVQDQNKEDALKFYLFDEMSRACTNIKRMNPVLRPLKDSQLKNRIAIVQPKDKLIQGILSILGKVDLTEMTENIFGREKYLNEFTPQLINFIKLIRFGPMLEDLEENNQNTTKSIDSMAWIIHLGILEHLEQKLGTDNQTRLAEVISKIISNGKADTFRKNIGDYKAGKIKENNPYSFDRIKKMNAYLTSKGLKAIK